MRFTLLFAFCMAVLAMAVELPPISMNYGISDKAFRLYNQINGGKISFDGDLAWAEFVRTHGEDHLTSGIHKIHTNYWMREREKDAIRASFQRYLSAPSGEIAVNDEVHQFLLKHLINAYDLA